MQWDCKRDTLFCQGEVVKEEFLERKQDELKPVQ